MATFLDDCVLGEADLGIKEEMVDDPFADTIETDQPRPTRSNLVGYFHHTILKYLILQIRTCFRTVAARQETIIGTVAGGPATSDGRDERTAARTQPFARGTERAAAANVRKHTGVSAGYAGAQPECAELSERDAGPSERADAAETSSDGCVGRTVNIFI